MKKIIDISIPLNEETIVYPGIESVEIKPRKSPSGSTVVSAISMNTHSGTHIDAPSHTIEGAKTIDEIPLETFVGDCRVLDLSSSKESIKKEEILEKNIKEGERILLKTKNSERGFNKFYDDYIFLSSEASEYLAELPIKIVGIDSLSIKQRGSKDTTPHDAFLSKDIPIIEGLNLKEISEGEYKLIVLPLALTGTDGSPARAILIEK